MAGPAVPDTDRGPLDGVLAAERASVAGVLGDFHLLDLLPQGGTITIFHRKKQLSAKSPSYPSSDPHFFVCCRNRYFVLSLLLFVSSSSLSSGRELE